MGFAVSSRDAIRHLVNKGSREMMLGGGGGARLMLLSGLSAGRRETRSGWSFTDRVGGAPSIHVYSHDSPHSTSNLHTHTGVTNSHCSLATWAYTMHACTPAHRFQHFRPARVWLPSLTTFNILLNYMYICEYCVMH